MPDRTWTDRQRREAQFYEKYAMKQQIDKVDLAPVEGAETRPWNPYWYVYGIVRNRFVCETQRLLDFGCGAGIAGVRYASLGYQVEGFDISPVNIKLARQLAQRHHVSDRCAFREMAAEQLDYPDNHFDIISGIDILHHVEVGPAIHEAFRVLKPGGVAIFKEHVEVPILDPIRNTTILRALAPKNKSLDHHITQDERKLNPVDLTMINQCFGHVDTKRFTLISRLDRLFSASADGLRRNLQKLDENLMRRCPSLAKLGGTVVMTCHKHHTTSSSYRRAA